MTNVVPNIAKGMIGYYGSLPLAPDDGFVLVLLKLAGIEDDDTLEDYDDLDAILANNDEADFTGYARASLSGVTLTRDYSADEVRVTATNPSGWTNTGALDQAVAKAVICYDPDVATIDDSTLIPVAIPDYAFTFVIGEPRTFTFATDGFVASVKQV